MFTTKIMGEISLFGPRIFQGKKWGKQRPDFRGEFLGLLGLSLATLTARVTRASHERITSVVQFFNSVDHLTLSADIDFNLPSPWRHSDARMHRYDDIHHHSTMVLRSAELSKIST
jgi:hypothetical protein